MKPNLLERFAMLLMEAAADLEENQSPVSAGVKAWVSATTEPIAEANLSVRATCVLESMGCLTTRDLSRFSATEILTWPNSGQQVLDQVELYAREHGIKLKPENDTSDVG